MIAVLDASALLALVYREAGCDRAEELVADGGVVSTVNWAEVLQKIATNGGDADQIGAMLQAAGLQLESFGADDARTSARLHPLTSQRGLSLGDRACLAVGARLGVTVVTADRAWEPLDGIAVDDGALRVELIR